MDTRCVAAGPVETQVRDTVGAARWRFTWDAGAGEVSGTKLGIGRGSDLARIGEDRRVRGASRVRLDVRLGWFDRVAIEETFEFGIEKMSVRVEIACHTTLRLQRHTMRPADLPETLSWQSLDASTDARVAWALSNPERSGTSASQSSGRSPAIMASRASTPRVVWAGYV